MTSCRVCGSETLNGHHDLCLSCFRSKGSKKESVTSQEENGLSGEELNFRYNMIKGRIAETLIEELFLSLGYNVFRYGMENTVPGILDLLKGMRNDVADNIRLMPDFVVQRGDKVYFIEVKYRSSEEYSIADLPSNYPYENTYFVIVSKKHIKCISFWELKAGMEISPSSKNYLGYRKEFKLDRQTIIDFCDFAVTFFERT
ncbi:MAG: YraN family protein [Methanomassiliicoccus sp.]|nr:YraN family protein [Methanomassiliicoccus sp.]